MIYCRKDTKSLYLRNPTMLPVLWRLSGLESLGDDFSVSQESGIIEPLQEFPLHAYFRAMKPVTTNKKSIRLEVSLKLPTKKHCCIVTSGVILHLRVQSFETQT